MRTIFMNEEMMDRLYKTSSRVTIIYKGIAPRYQKAQYGKWLKLINFLSDLRQYTLANIGVNPPMDAITKLKIDAETLVQLSKARRDLKALNETLAPEKRNNNFKFCMDTLDLFEWHFKQMIARGA